jgi:branched-chain amino acid aminotransferase
MNKVNRAFIYGDLLFETIRVKDGSAMLAHAHYTRLIHSARLLQWEVDLSLSEFTKAISGAVADAGLTDARVRFVLHRDGAGFYLPETNQAKWFVEVFPLPFIQNSVAIGLYTDNYKPCNELSTLKTGNALIYVMAAVWARQNGFEDALLLNEHGCVCEATSSNVFVVKNEKVITPPISEGCVNGVMRQVVLNRLKDQQYDVSEGLVTIEQIQEADAVFLTNAIAGIRRVSRFEDRPFDDSKGGMFRFESDNNYEVG